LLAPTIRARRRGARAYLAVSGGIDVPVVLGSRATHVGSGMGGFRGRALAAGDQLPLGPTRGHVPGARATVSQDEVEALTPLAPEGGRLRIVPAPEHERFATDAVAALQSGVYLVGPESNRMGYRLTGPPLPNAVGADILSSATAAGVLQVPASGAPVLLMADRQTTGGYARIAAVVSADLDVAGQLAPGDRLTFEMCSLRDALGALVAREQVLMGIEARVAR
jgi:antagonist of KipI